MTIKDLEPKKVWEIFHELNQVPRPSKHEEQVQKFLMQWAKDNNVEAFMDETGNIIMKKAASPGYEDRKGVIIQAHMDMVPQKSANVKHDFMKDPIQTQIVGEWVKAKGTTLGADNGIGLAIGMAILVSDNLKHGPVELLITYDEETGMTGANSLKPGILEGDILLNLDSEREGELCIGCAGGLNAKASFEISRKAMPENCKAYKIDIKSLHGGHSGMDIKLFKANANKLLARLLLALTRDCKALVSDIKGGSLRNAIPYEGEAIFSVPQAEAQNAEALVEKIFSEIKFEYQYSDPDGKYKLETLAEVPENYIDSADMLRVIRAILAGPNGVERMSDTMPGLTETSVNLAIVRCYSDRIEIISLMRSAIDSAKYYLSEQLRAAYELAGAKYEVDGAYTGWVPKPDTPIYTVINGVYKKLFGEDMEIMATHGGLECAILGSKYPHWEMASVGPTIEYPHSPDERVNIKAVENCWNLVLGILEEIPSK